jgi:hypothetical protein
MRQYRKMCTEHGWEPASDDLIFRATIMVAERPEALTNTIADFLDLRETFIVSRRDSRINP